MRSVLSALLLACVAPGLMGAQQPAAPPLPPGMGQYVMVLWESGTPLPNDPGKTMHVTEPDIASLGGQLISKSANRRVIRLPLAAANGLRHHPSVAYLQRLWMGESFDHWNESLSVTDPSSSTSSASPSRHKVETDTNLQWGPKAYSYDGGGNITQIGTDQYTYDSAGRLIQAVVSGKTERYSYDAFGNLTQKGVDGANPVNIPVDGGSNRLSGVSYDAAGNVLNGGSDGRRTYSYDSLNMVTRIRPFGTDRRYIYDADDEQIGMLYPTLGPVVETSRWTFRDFEGHVIREYRAEQFDNTQGGLWIWEQDSFYGEGMLLGGETQAFGFNYNGTTTVWGGKRHYHLDHLSSVRMVTDDMGRSLSENDYFPFGATMTRTYQEQFNWADPHIDSMRFAGHRRDFLGVLNEDSTDYLDNMHARYYDPNLGRFLSVDPTWSSADLGTPQSWNRYSYVRNNPELNTDPDGKICVPCAGFIVGGTIGIIAGGAYETYHVIKDGRPVDNGNIVFAGALGATLGTSLGFDLLESPAACACSADDPGSRTQAFNEAKRENDIPTSQQPDRTIKPGTPEGDKAGLDSRNVQQFEFTNHDGKKISIREDKAADYHDGGKPQGPHFNAGEAGKKLDQHYYFVQKPEKQPRQ